MRQHLRCYRMDAQKMKGHRQHRGKTTVGAACLIATTIWMGCSGIICAQEHVTRADYSSLQPIPIDAEEKRGGTDAVDEAGRWEQLLDTNDACAGWISVAGTSISYPLMQADPHHPHYYLSHDFSKQRSGSGCPYIDARTSLDGQHIMVFGHHIMGSDTMFGPIADAWKPVKFNKLSSACIARPDGSILTFEALCSFKTVASNADIQTFTWNNSAVFADWLQLQLERADAKDESAKIKNPKQVLTLVTCSGDIPGRSERTVVLFIRKM